MIGLIGMQAIAAAYSIAYTVYSVRAKRRTQALAVALLTLLQCAFCAMLLYEFFALPK